MGILGVHFTPFLSHIWWGQGERSLWYLRFISSFFLVQKIRYIGWDCLLCCEVLLLWEKKNQNTAQDAPKLRAAGTGQGALGCHGCTVDWGAWSSHARCLGPRGPFPQRPLGSRQRCWARVTAECWRRWACLKHPRKADAPSGAVAEPRVRAPLSRGTAHKWCVSAKALVCTPRGRWASVGSSWFLTCSCPSTSLQ